MSPTQQIIWTACPNGVAAGGMLRISVAVGPQLFTGTASPSVLKAFPDFTDWPATKIGWTATIGAHTVSATVVSAKPSAPLYQALFHPAIPVNPYAYVPRRPLNIYTYPASYLQGVFQGIYSHLAATLPKGGGVHGVDQLSNDTAFGLFPTDQREFTDLLDKIKASFPPRGGPLPVADTHSPPVAAALATLFLRPLAPPGNGTPAPPKFDFHQAFSLLQRHPALLRLFGFVVDLQVPRPAGLPATVGLSVTPAWTPKLGTASTTNVSPVTMTTSASWLAEPSATNTLISGGMLRLSDPGSYDVVEMDVDGTTIKALNFVQGIVFARDRKPSADTPTAYGAPSLRSAGLSLSMTSHAQQVYANWQANDDFAATLPAPVTLFAEDIAQGYRIDLWDSKHARWFQLCARSGNPRGINGYGIGKPRKIVPVPAGDEGWIEPVVTQPPGQPTAPVNLPETMLRWDGWSVVASRPGKHLSDTAPDSLEADTGNPPPASADFQLQTDYAATPGTLPVLRFGRGYRFRARAVDLAGNSLPFAKTASFAFATPEVVYGRLEPVGSPVIVPCAPRTPGESLETLVIRSNFDIPDATVTPCERHLAPPATSIEMALTHGVLDGAAGHPGSAEYTMLASRDGLTYKSPSVLAHLHGKVEPLAAGDWIYYPPAGTFDVPYLPDVMGCGVCLLGLPGAGSGRVIVPFGTGWPDKRALRLVIEAGSGTPVKPPGNAVDGPITVRAPKASVTTVRLSSVFAPAQLGLLKLYQWLAAAGLATPALRALILEGGHYMVTPFRELTIVHAVRQPLSPPTVHLLAPFRTAGVTYALLNGDVRAHPPSTQRVDVLSSYTDPFDDGTSATGIVGRESQARVAELQLASGASPVVPVKGMRHDFGDTKHHTVFYSLLATTRFLEYFTSSSAVVLHGTTAVVASAHGFAQGTVAVQGTGANAHVTYAEGTDYTENDTAGSIARLAAGRIPDGAHVQVTYNAPPVTRSSLEKDAHPPAPRGYAVDIPSSARPPAPDLRYLIPAFTRGQSSTSAKKTSVRLGNTLRVYLGRPWFQTGADELLGVVVQHPVPPGAAFPQDLLPYLSGYGQDPVFTGRRGAAGLGRRLLPRGAQGHIAAAGRAERDRALRGRRRARGVLGRLAQALVRGHSDESRRDLLPVREARACQVPAELAGRARAVPRGPGRLHPGRAEPGDAADVPEPHGGPGDSRRARLPRHHRPGDARLGARLHPDQDGQDVGRGPAVGHHRLRRERDRASRGLPDGDGYRLGGERQAAGGTRQQAVPHPGRRVRAAQGGPVREPAQPGQLPGRGRDLKDAGRVLMQQGGAGEAEVVQLGQAAFRRDEREVAAPYELPGQPALELAGDLGRDPLRRPAGNVDVDVGLVQRHRDQVHVPGPAEVRGHHRQPRVSRRHRVQLQRVRVVDPDALAAGLAGADPARAGVKERQQAVRLARGEHRLIPGVVGREGLQRRVEFDAPQSQRRNVRHLRDGRLALVRVDRADPGERARVAFAGGRHGLVGHPGAAGGGLRVPGEEHRRGVERAVLVG